jgi:hypothetical protein
VRDSARDLTILESLLPSENGLRVFDAETQETSYGIASLEGRPEIYDTHRRDGHYVATLELLTEIVEPVRISANRVERFCQEARAMGLLSVPYTGCFFLRETCTSTPSRDPSGGSTSSPSDRRGPPRNVDFSSGSMRSGRQSQKRSDTRKETCSKERAPHVIQRTWTS